ncbi:MAG: DevR family CRISPR-associated autoregulator [Nitrososphaeria archaeon]
MYIGVAVKSVLNMHDLNNERAEEIRRVPIIYRDENGEWNVFEEAVAVSGIMIKHWHFAYMVTLGSKENVDFCDYCKRLEAIRVPSEKQEGKKTKEGKEVELEENEAEASTEKKARSELDIISKCAGEDIHGFLRAKPSLRRESLVKFSWMLPTPSKESIEKFGLPTPFRVLQHSRNVREIPSGAPEEVRQAQMPYPRSYANGIYGFVSILNLAHIGHSFTDDKDIEDKDKIATRKRIAVQAYIPMLTGAVGASLARALPVSDILDVIVIHSDKPIPAPVHPIYPDYINENIKLYEGVSNALECDITMYQWSKEKTNEKEQETNEKGQFKVIHTKTPVDGFTEIIKKL